MLTLFIIIIAIMLFTWYVIRNLHDPQDEDDIELPPSEPQLKPASPSLAVPNPAPKLLSSSECNWSSPLR